MSNLETLPKEQGDAALPFRPIDYDRRLLKPVSMVAATVVCSDLDRFERFLTEFLGMECVRPEKDLLLVRDRDPLGERQNVGERNWVLEVRYVEKVANRQNMFNHFGVDVASNAEVDAAYENAQKYKEYFGLTRVQSPDDQHNAYSFYLCDADANWWEIECRPPGDTNVEAFAKGDCLPDEFGARQ